MTKLVWEHFNEGGNVKLVLLCLADFSDNEGVAWPSMVTIARRLACSESQARRTVHRLLEIGVVEVVSNGLGGAPGSSRHYRILVDRLTAGVDAAPTPCTDDTPTPCTDATPVTDARGSTDARDGCHRCAETGVTGDTQTVIELPRTVKAPSRRKEGQTLKTFLETCKRDGVQPIPADDKVWDYAEKICLPEGLLELCWKEFRSRHLDERKDKRQKDWPATFRNCVKSNWYRLWFVADDGSYRATTAGRMSEKAHAAP